MIPECQASRIGQRQALSDRRKEPIRSDHRSGFMKALAVLHLNRLAAHRHAVRRMLQKPQGPGQDAGVKSNVVVHQKVMRDRFCSVHRSNDRPSKAARTAKVRLADQPHTRPVAQCAKVRVPKNAALVYQNDPAQGRFGPLQIQEVCHCRCNRLLPVKSAQTDRQADSPKRPLVGHKAQIVQRHVRYGDRFDMQPGHFGADRSVPDPKKCGFGPRDVPSPQGHPCAICPMANDPYRKSPLDWHCNPMRRTLV